MGIEDEQLVLDYLSRVGDLAHGTDLSAAERRALVGRLRDEIGRQRASGSGSGGGDSGGADVRRILGRMGRPEDVVAAAAGSGGASVPTPRAPAPDASSSEPPEVPRAPVVPPAPTGADRPKVPGARDGHWPDGPIGRWVGGVEIPELMGGPPGEAAEAAGERAADEDDRPTLAKTRPQPAAVPDEQTAGKGRTRRRLWRPRIGGSGRKGVPRAGGPVEWLGAFLLVAGGLFPGIVVLALGWLAAYWSPRLSRRAAQWATFGMPGLVAGGYLAWLAGRSNGTWGAPLAQGAADEALAGHWPWLLRGAALASAAFLVWKARRPRPPEKSEKPEK